MVDRQFAYAGAIPQNTDVLSTNKNMLYGLGHLAQAALGTGTCVVGLAGAQSTVPNLQISIGPGAIYSVQPVDGAAYGDLGTDANTLVKQGILKAAQTLTLTPPGTSGYSQVYLVEATYSDTDGGAAVLPYYNSSNPSAPYAGPANAGTSNYTVRQGVCTITLKAGTAAPTGSQTTPSTDAGYVPLYTITLANGQTAITTAQIIAATAAPFVPYSLNNIQFYLRQRLQANTTFYLATTGSDTGAGTIGSPWATLQRAWSILTNTYDLNGYTATIKLADGGYSALNASGPLVGSGQVLIVGNVASPGNVTISGAAANALSFIGNCNGLGNPTNVQGVTLSSSGGSGITGNGIYVQNATVSYSNVNFGPCVFAHVYSNSGSYVIVTGNYNITGNATYHLYINAGASFNAVSITTNISASLTIGCFVGCFTSYLYHVSGIFTGSTPAAQRYNAVSGGAIITNGGGPNYFPGTAVGSSTTGYYS